MLKTRPILRPEHTQIEQFPFDPAGPGNICLVTLAQLTRAGDWQLTLPHDREAHLLIWITRGQGVALLDGSRRGIGAHNALFVPSRHLFSLELGRQGYGLALSIPAATPLTLPRSPQHLRIRDVEGQSELTLLMEALGREQGAARALCQGAIDAYGDLVAIWLRRQMGAQMGGARDDTSLPVPPETAARHLSRQWCAHLVDHYASPASMAEHAAELGVTPTHLTRVSRAETGKTAARLLSERQLHGARQLLISTRVPVLDIARHLGFGSAAYFTRFIKQHTGHTPTALRRLARNRP